MSLFPALGFPPRQLKDALGDMYAHHLSAQAVGDTADGEEGDKEEDYDAYVCNVFSISK